MKQQGGITKLLKLKLIFRYNSNKSQKEGKLTLSDGNWVSLILTDESVGGRPTLVVAREKAAVMWMDHVFPELCSRIPGSCVAWAWCLQQTFKF